MRGVPGKVPEGDYQPIEDQDPDAAPGPANSDFELYEMGMMGQAPPPADGKSRARPWGSGDS